MQLRRNKLYLIILLACLAGYTWLYISRSWFPKEELEIEVCLIKHATNIPCPSCGSTRSVHAILNGDFVEGLLINPLGYIVFSIMTLIPLWIILDLIFKKPTFLIFYQRAEDFIKRPSMIVLLIVLVLINWVWNIKKGL